MSTSRRFHLQRTVDVTGASGTGHVADGVRWPDGTVSIRWAGERPSVVFWASIDDAERVHGHDGATRIVWDEGSPDQTAELESQIRAKYRSIMDRDMSAEAQEALQAMLDAALALHDKTFCTTCLVPNCETRQALTAPAAPAAPGEAGRG